MNCECRCTNSSWGLDEIRILTNNTSNARLNKDKGARIQVLDLPGIIEGAAEGKGRGRQVISTARTCNLILIVLDSAKPLTHKKVSLINCVIVTI